MDMTALNRSSIILAAIVNAFIMICFFEKDIQALVFILQNYFVGMMIYSMVGQHLCLLIVFE